MAKQAYIWDGTQFVPIGSQAATATSANTVNTVVQRDGSGDINVNNVITSVQTGFRNKLINGGFDIWQRGAGPFNLTTTTYGADRFAGFRQGGVAGLTSTRVDSDLNGFRYFNRLQRTSGNTSTATNYFGASFESNAFSIPLRGKPLVFSFYARRGANYSGTSGTLFRLYWATGTGTDLAFATATTGEVTTSLDFNLTTSWVRYQMVIPAVPSTTTATRYFFEWIPTGTAGANDYVDLTGLQLEEGTVATSFEQRPIGTELALCQRYYWRSISGGVYTYFATGSAQNTSTIFASTSLPVTMRISPTSIDIPALANFWVENGTASTTSLTGVTIATTICSPNVLGLSIASSAAFTAGLFYRFLGNNTANAYVGVSAEL
jgi:hypothetical protein